MGYLPGGYAAGPGESASRARERQGESNAQAAVATIVEELSSEEGRLLHGIPAKKTGLVQIEARGDEIVPGRMMDNEEKIIGVIHNNSPDNSIQGLALAGTSRTRTGS
jgi:hypothetical protein